MLNAWLYYAKNLDGGCMGKTLQILLHFLTMSLEVSKCHPSVSGCSSCCHRSRSRRAVGRSENPEGSTKGYSSSKLWSSAVECCAQKLYVFHFSRMISFLPAHLTCQKTSQSKKMKTRFL